MTVMTRLLGVAALAMTAAAPAWAGPLVWTLDNVHFDDGAIATGTFTFDADTTVISAWSITVSGGTAGLATFTYTKDGTQNALAFTPGAVPFESLVFTDSSDPLSTNRYMKLTTVTPLSDSGGVIALVTGAFSVDCDNCGTYHNVDGGSVVTLGEAATPEPATWALTILGFGAIGMTLRTRRRTSVAFG